MSAGPFHLGRYPGTNAYSVRKAEAEAVGADPVGAAFWTAH